MILVFVIQNEGLIEASPSALSQTQIQFAFRDHHLLYCCNKQTNGEKLHSFIPLFI